MSVDESAQQGIALRSGFLARLETVIDYAFQPIVNLNTGCCHGVEALMRGWQDTGLDSIDAVLDHAHEQGVLVEADRILKRLAFEKFSRIAHAQDLRLFFNVDNRLAAYPGHRPATTLRLIDANGLKPSALVLEVSERTHLDVSRDNDSSETLAIYRRNTVQMALDDFGKGFSSLALLYDIQPEYIKIDRYFITDIGQDQRKKVFVSHVVSLAKTLGIRVVAEGVETVPEFYTCREIGCDLVQGYLVQRPTTEINELRSDYALVTQLCEQDQRRDKLESRFVAEQLDRAPVLDNAMEMRDIFESLRLNSGRSFFPFLAENRQPVGLVRETELRAYIHSSYGRDLLSCKRIGDNLDSLVRRCPIADINTPIDAILEQYAVNPGHGGALITEGGTYIGVLSADSLVLAIQRRNLELARDRNPLTGLPGSPVIERFILDHRTSETPVMLLYFDLDHFKIFNDAYGFRLGDRVLQMFADMLRRYFLPFDPFIGHAGGDDFVVGVSYPDFAAILRATDDLRMGFRSSVLSFYDPAHRRAGYMSGIDRYGRPSRFALLAITSVMVAVTGASRNRAESPLLALVDALKAEAKIEGDTINAASLI